jgi:VWFA-related protein
MRIREAAIVAVLSAVAVSAQQVPTFRTGTNVVAIEASVVDKDGKPVLTLTADDFEIKEDGVVQPIQTIYLASSNPAFVRTQPSAKTTDPPAIAPEPQASLRRELRPRVFVFLFDLSHLSADGYKRSRTAVESFLKDGALPGDLVGVVSGGVMLNNKIDSDKAALIKAMDGMKGPNLSRFNELRVWPTILNEEEASAIARSDRETLSRATQRACDQRPDECASLGGQEPVRAQIEVKARQINAEAQKETELTLTMLQTLAAGLGRFGGSKHVLVFSEGFFTGEKGGRLKTVVEQAARNNVRFSTLDARGLGRDLRSQNIMGEQPLQGSGDLSVLGFDSNADVLASLAIDTGGEVLNNRNNLRPAIDIISRSTEAAYVIGFATDKPMDGSYRTLTVRLKRPDLTVRARKGYIANSSGTSATGSGAGAPGSGAIAGGSGADAGGLVRTQPPAIAPERPAAAPERPAAAPEPAAKLPEPPAKNPELPGSRLRPNSAGNVASLAKSSTTGGSAREAETLADEGWDAYSRGDVKTAREKLSAAVATGRAADWAVYALGQAEFALSNYSAAATAWESVRAKVPEFLPVYFDLADAYLSLDRSGDALSVLRVSASRWPADPEAQNALGTLLVKRGALDDALDVFKRITTAKPTDSLGYFNLGRTYHLMYLRLQQTIATSAIRNKPNALGEDDRKRAIDAYKQYLALGGPFEKEAKDAISILEWR